MALSSPTLTFTDWTNITVDLFAVPGAPVTAVPWGENFALFATERAGVAGSDAPYVRCTEVDQNLKLTGPWLPVTDGFSGTPGAAIAGIPWQRTCALCAIDNAGLVRFATGDPNGLSYWTGIEGITAKPGSAVALVENGTGLAVFAVDTSGVVFSAAGVLQPPDAPTNFHVTGVTADTISLAWVDDTAVPDGVTGFRISYPGNTINLPSGDRTNTLTGLQSNYLYGIELVAFNEAGDSPSIGVNVKTGAATPQVVELWMKEQPAETPYYTATYPALGTVHPGHLQQISVPAQPDITALLIVKAGHSTEEVSTNPDAYVAIPVGGHTTPTQLSAIFGVSSYPIAFSDLGLGTLVAIIAQRDGQPLLPEYVFMDLTVIFDG